MTSTASPTPGSPTRGMYNYSIEHVRNGDQTGPNLIIVSNRLPVSFSKTEEGSFEFSKSSGGLVTALMGIEREFFWMGWLGTCVRDEDKEMVSKQLWEQHSAVPVFVDDEEMASDYYNGFSNGILWPLFHYLFEKEATFDKKKWEAYRNVNQIFCDTLAKFYQPGDYVWIHDYHLMLLPQMLREVIPEAKIGFFLHIPFPSSEIYRTLPVRLELLEGVLAANLIGFHTYDYCRHFLSSCTRTLGAETSATSLTHGGMQSSVGVFPIGIDPNKFKECLEFEETQQRLAELRKKFAGIHVILGVDRVDYTKGLILKLKSYEVFLEQHPEYKNRTVLLQVGVPSRQDVEEYQNLISEVNELVGKINSKHGTIDFFPVHYINKSVSFIELCALYALADVMLITAIRDGMNLVSYEYVACQEKSHGVLMLSEFTGAASSLSGSVLINPFDIEKTAKTMATVLTMPENDRKARFYRNHIVVTQYNTAPEWGKLFMEEFDKLCTPDSVFMLKTPPLSEQHLVSKYNNISAEEKRVFFLDYDGTLVQIHKYPHLARPTPELIDALDQLSRDPRNEVFIISGRDRGDLEDFFGHLPVGLAAEHGVICRFPRTDEWVPVFTEIDLSWMDTVKPILEHITCRTPGSSLEIKKYSLCFHYRNVEANYGKWRSNELRLNLEMSFANLPIDIVAGKKVLEIRCIGVNKGAMVRKLLSMIENPGFVFCVGDDRTDEDMFGELNKYENGITCLVGKPFKPSLAMFRLSTPAQIVRLLSKLGTPLTQ